MDTNNVKSAHFWQSDHKIKSILKIKGIIILPSPEAWERFKWTREYFEKKPKEGYFIWLQKQVDFPLMTCVQIASPKISQNLKNLLVIEKGLKAKAKAVCNVKKEDLCGTHKAKGKILLKENSALDYEHFHKWGKKDFVNPEYEFVLERNSQLRYSYKNLFPPKVLKLKTNIHVHKNSSANIEFVIDGKSSKIEIKDTIFLREKDSRGLIKLRLVGRKGGKIDALSKIVAEKAGQGHLDCQGLITDKDSQIKLVPELLNKNKNALITHEASIGRISEETLNYLRMRGLSEEEAIDLIISGFLKT